MTSYHIVYHTVHYHLNDMIILHLTNYTRYVFKILGYHKKNP